MMPRRFKTDTATPKRPNWREYQDGLKWSAAKTKIVNGSLKYSVLALLLFVVIYGIASGLSGKSFSHLAEDYISPFNDGHSFDKERVQTLLNGVSFVNLKDKSFDIVSNGHKLK